MVAPRTTQGRLHDLMQPHHFDVGPNWFVYCGRALLFITAMRGAWAFFVHCTAGDVAFGLEVSRAEALLWLVWVGFILPTYSWHEKERLCRLWLARSDDSRHLLPQAEASLPRTCTK